MRRAMAIAAVMALILAACGSDDAATDEAGAFCTNFVEANTQVALMETPAGDPEAVVAATQAAVESAPEELTSDVETMAAFAQSDGEGSDFEAFEAAQLSVNAWIADNCGFDEVAVTAEDYSYSEAPESLDAGTRLVSFANEGSELHEALFVKINEGVDLTAAELLELPDEELLPQVTPVGAAFAAPGETASVAVDFGQSGDYFVICFIAVGSTPDALAEAEESGSEPEEGPPHFTQGMLTTFTVE